MKTIGVNFNRNRYFQIFGHLSLMKDDGLCPECKKKRLIMSVDELGVHGILCKKCGWEKLVDN